MYCDQPFSQRNKATKREGVGGGVGQLDNFWHKESSL